MGVKRLIVCVSAALLTLAGAAEAQRSQRRPPTEDERRAAIAAMDRFTSPTLARFDSEAEFRRFLDAAREVERIRDRYFYYSRLAADGFQFAQISDPTVQSDEQNPLCDPALEECPESPGGGAETIFVTGSRIPPPSNPSITNNQMRGVEEGDIVKQIDRFLIVLQDGRLFVVDTGAADGALVLAHRANVYRNPASDMWYDEMLVFGDRILVTGYSYDEGATELAIFRLDASGQLTREGVFRISSNDYYSTSNYATRLVDGNLVTYTPLRIEDLERADFSWPVVRRWLPADDERMAVFLERRRSNWRLRPNDPPASEPPLMDAANIYRPVRRIENDVVIHSLSICPLASADGGGRLACRSVGFVGPEVAQWYVTGEHAYLWTVDRGEGWRDLCASGDPIEISRTERSLVYRVQLPRLQPSVVGARGAPPDQFAMHAADSRFYALVRLIRAGCSEPYDSPSQLAFLSLPTARFSPTVTDAPADAFTDVPGTENHHVASRFTERYLVYGGLSRFRRGYPDFDRYADYGSSYRRRMLRDLQPRPAFVVPIGRPYAVEPLSIGHTVIRAERVADDIVLTGYRDRRGLSISLIDLTARPRVGSTVVLDGRFESEARSHAFNSLVEEDGGGLMGLPTVGRVEESQRYHWRSQASDVSFLSFDPRGRLQPIGELERRFEYVDEYDDESGEEDEDGVPGYECEVSCIDWYGNSRPIFTGGRIFALAGTELIEGRVDGGRIREVQRLNIALTPARD